MHHIEAGSSYAAREICPVLKTTLLVAKRLLKGYSGRNTKCVVVGRVISMKPFVLNDCTDCAVLEVKGELSSSIHVGHYMKCVLGLVKTKHQLELKSATVAKSQDLLMHLAEVLRIESSAELAAKRVNQVVVEEAKENIEPMDMSIPLRRFRDWLLTKHNGFSLEQMMEEFRDAGEFETFKKAVEQEYKLVCMGDYFEAFSIEQLQKRAKEIQQ